MQKLRWWKQSKRAERKKARFLKSVALYRETNNGSKYGLSHGLFMSCRDSLVRSVLELFPEV